MAVREGCIICRFTGPLGPCLYTLGLFVGGETSSRDFEEPVLNFCHPTWWEVGSSHVPDFCSFIFPFLVLLAHIFFLSIPHESLC